MDESKRCANFLRTYPLEVSETDRIVPYEREILNCEKNHARVAIF